MVQFGALFATYSPQRGPFPALTAPDLSPTMLHMRIGLLADTHLPGRIRTLDELGPEPARFFSTVDLILHAGDLTSPIVLDWLEQFAPVLCATGNNDPIPDPRIQDVQTLEIHGWSIGMVHSLDRQFRPMSELQRHFPAPVDVMIAGHTHMEALEYRDGVVLINTGSITFPRHKELRLGGVGLLELAPDHLSARVWPLGETPGRPNPCETLSLDIENGRMVSAREGADSVSPTLRSAGLSQVPISSP